MLGFQDEVWFSRLTQPHLHVWTLDRPLALVSQCSDKDDPNPAAIACYGLLRADTGQMLLRFVAGRPVSEVTITFLAWVLECLAQEGKAALLMLWDNASWHLSHAVRRFLKEHNRTVKRQGGCRLLVCALPSKSPWLNNIEPKWVHGKRAVVEPAAKLTAEELRQRLCAYYDCPLLEPIAQNVP